MNGITITLYDRTQTGTDALNKPIYAETPVTVDDVLVAPSSETEVLEAYNLTGRKAIYTLGIPKGDTNDWSSGKKVNFFGQDFRIIGEPIQGIEALIPLRWNKKVRVEIYEQG